MVFIYSNAFRFFVRILINYFVLVGISAHIALVAGFILYPDMRYKLENKVSILFKEKIKSGKNLGDEIKEAFGVWEAVKFPVIEPQKIVVEGREFTDLQTAANDLKPGDILEIGPGIYKTPLIISQSRISVIGRGSVVFDGPTAEGKAAIIVKGNDVRINNIECKGIKVADQNGACLRLEGSNLSVEHVYFHDSEQGILTGKQPGRVTIRDSRFELLGRNGQAHGIYIGGGELHIEDSLFIAAVDEGHEIKSRARVTEIVRTVVASLASKDSRLVDISDGGLVTIRDSVLEKGPNSSNGDLIGYGLENMKYSSNDIDIKNNIIIMEREGPNNLIHAGNAGVLPKMDSNVVISENKPEFSGFNIWYKSRKKAGFGEYPYIPKVQ